MVQALAPGKSRDDIATGLCKDIVNQVNGQCEILSFNDKYELTVPMNASAIAVNCQVSVDEELADILAKTRAAEQCAIPMAIAAQPPNMCLRRSCPARK